MLNTDFKHAVTAAHTLVLLEILILIDEVSFELYNSAIAAAFEYMELYGYKWHN